MNGERTKPPIPTGMLVARGLSALALAMGFGRFAYTLILPLMRSPQFDTTAAGVVASANYFGYFAGAAPAGTRFCRRFRRELLVAALLISVATTAGMALAIDEASRIALRLAGGIASAFVFVYSSSAVIDELRLRGAERFADVVYGGIGIGIAASSIAVTLLPRTATFKTAWLLIAALSAAALLVSLGGFGRAPSRDTAAPRPHSKGTTTPAAYLLAASFFAEAIGYAIPATFIVYFLSRDPALSGFRSLAWLVVGVCAAPSTIVWGRIGRRVGNLQAVLLAMLVQTIGVVTGAIFPNLITTLILSAALGATFVGITLLVIRAGVDLSTSDTSSTVSRLTTVFGIGQIIGPLLAVFVEAKTGSSSAALLAGAIVLSTGIVLILPTKALLKAGAAPK